VVRPAPSGTLDDLVADLVAEHETLLGLVTALSSDGWDAPTPAEGWAVRDQISHLAFFDDLAALAMRDPAAFAPVAEAAVAAMASGDDPMAEHLARGRSVSGAELLRWWDDARRALVEAVPAVAPGARVPWFGPPMSTMSFLSARLMETWAHGQDVADALGAARPPSDRLVHVARLGVRSRPFSFAVRGLDDPPGTVQVVLTSPEGEEWSFAEGDDDDEVRGPILDFCLVVTQRRHVGDTALVVRGPVARQWMAVAQAFAGPPGPGRPRRGA